MHNGGTSNTDKFPNAAFPGGCADEEWFGINAQILVRDNPTDFFETFTADDLDPRTAFDLMKNIWTGN